MSQEIIDEKVLELIDRSLLEHPDIGYVSPDSVEKGIVQCGQTDGCVIRFVRG